MPYEKLDDSQIVTKPLSERESFIDIRQAGKDPLMPLGEVSDLVSAQLDRLAEKIKSARSAGATVSICYGAHLIKNGGGTYVNWLVENDWVTHVATQGAGIIHDWEFAFGGVSSESVEANAPVGEFGSWAETGRAINTAAVWGAAHGMGLGEAIGKLIEEDGVLFPHPGSLMRAMDADQLGELTAAKADLLRFMAKNEIEVGRWDITHKFKQYSVPAACYRKGIPMTVHPGIGYDIYTNHPMFSPAALGRAAGTDARIFAKQAENLTGGVYLSVGSAIMSPQVFEKAFSLANNVRNARGEDFISQHYIGIVDIQDGGNWDWTQGEPPKEHPAYYLRFCKSFYRMGGMVDYLCFDNCQTLSNLIKRLA